MLIGTKVLLLSLAPFCYIYIVTITYIKINVLYYCYIFCDYLLFLANSKN